MRTIGFLHSGSRDSFEDAWKTLKENLPKDIEIKDKYANDDAGVLKNLPGIWSMTDRCKPSWLREALNPHSCLRN